MRVVCFHEHGGPEVLKLEEWPVPEPGPGQALVRVEAVALNHLDLWVRGGLPNLKLHYPHVLGSDVAGEVAALGPGVAGADLAVGQKIVVNPGLSCGRCRECLSGHDNLCRSYAILGEHVPGGYCEYLAVPAANLVPRPAGLSATEAAAFPLAFLTAWQMLVDKAAVRPGETVVILGASSGVGSAAVQIAKLLGARVIATATSDDKLERARSLGADEVLNTLSEDLVDGVRKRTGKRGADVIFEHIGKALFAKAILACARGGRIVTCGATTGYDPAIDLRHIFFRQISILGSTMGSKGVLYDIAAHMAAGRLKPVVDRVLPFAQARAAHELLEDRRQFGKIVLSLT
jgi:NADPH:quinone reductase-like Zn-dependent oxidoreductase